MNAALATLFPPAVVIVQEAPVTIATRHQEMMRGSAALHDVSLEDLSPENITIMLELTDQIRSHLFQCQVSAAVTSEAQTG